jgi:hypothetical protein
MASGFTFVVYDPPEPGLPHLAVMIAPNGQVSAAPYPTAHEAELHNARMAAEVAKGP